MSFNRNNNYNHYFRDPEVEKSFQKFADQIGYKNSPLKNQFIELLNKEYQYLHEVRHKNVYSGSNWTSYYPMDDKEKEIRDKLNAEVIERRNARPLFDSKSHLTISEISDFSFCPISYAIKISYDTEDLDEIYTLQELKSDNYPEEVLERIKKKRRLDFIILKLGIKKDDLPKVNIIEKIIGDLIQFELIGTEKFSLNDLRFKFGLSDNKPTADLNPGYHRFVSAPISEYNKFLNRGEFGDIFQSKLVFNSHTKSNKEIYYNSDRSISGIPEYIYINPTKSKFILLSKLTRNKEPIRSPFINHLVQCIGYSYFFPQLEIKYGYIFYIQSINTVRLFKSVFTDFYKKTLLSAKSNLEVFREKRKMIFNTKSINVRKCFGCSVRMYCSHKAGLSNSVVLPYKIF